MDAIDQLLHGMNRLLNDSRLLDADSWHQLIHAIHECFTLNITNDYFPHGFLDGGVLGASEVGGLQFRDERYQADFSVS